MNSAESNSKSNLDKWLESHRGSCQMNPQLSNPYAYQHLTNATANSDLTSLTDFDEIDTNLQPSSCSIYSSSPPSSLYRSADFFPGKGLQGGLKTDTSLSTQHDFDKKLSIAANEMQIQSGKSLAHEAFSFRKSLDTDFGSLSLAQPGFDFPTVDPGSISFQFDHSLYPMPYTSRWLISYSPSCAKSDFIDETWKILFQLYEYKIRTLHGSISKYSVKSGKQRPFKELLSYDHLDFKLFLNASKLHFDPVTETISFRNTTASIVPVLTDAMLLSSRVNIPNKKNMLLSTTLDVIYKSLYPINSLASKPESLSEISQEKGNAETCTQLEDYYKEDNISELSDLLGVLCLIAQKRSDSYPSCSPHWPLFQNEDGSESVARGKQAPCLKSGSFFNSRMSLAQTDLQLKSTVFSFALLVLYWVPLTGAYHLLAEDTPKLSNKLSFSGPSANLEDNSEYLIYMFSPTRESFLPSRELKLDEHKLFAYILRLVWVALLYPKLASHFANKDIKTQFLQILDKELEEFSGGDAKPLQPCFKDSDQCSDDSSVYSLEIELLEFEIENFRRLKQKFANLLKRLYDKIFDGSFKLSLKQVSGYTWEFTKNSKSKKFMDIVGTLLGPFQSLDTVYKLFCDLVHKLYLTKNNVTSARFRQYIQCDLKSGRVVDKNYQWNNWVFPVNTLSLKEFETGIYSTQLWDSKISLQLLGCWKQNAAFAKQENVVRGMENMSTTDPACFLKIFKSPTLLYNLFKVLESRGLETGEPNLNKGLCGSAELMKSETDTDKFAIETLETNSLNVIENDMKSSSNGLGLEKDTTKSLNPRLPMQNSGEFRQNSKDYHNHCSFSLSKLSRRKLSVVNSATVVRRCSLASKGSSKENRKWSVTKRQEQCGQKHSKRVSTDHRVFRAKRPRKARVFYGKRAVFHRLIAMCLPRRHGKGNSYLQTQESLNSHDFISDEFGKEDQDEILKFKVGSTRRSERSGVHSLLKRLNGKRETKMPLNERLNNLKQYDSDGSWVVRKSILKTPAMKGDEDLINGKDKLDIYKFSELEEQQPSSLLYNDGCASFRSDDSENYNGTGVFHTRKPESQFIDKEMRNNNETKIGKRIQQDSNDMLEFRKPTNGPMVESMYKGLYDDFSKSAYEHADQGYFHEENEYICNETPCPVRFQTRQPGLKRDVPGSLAGSTLNEHMYSKDMRCTPNNGPIVSDLDRLEEETFSEDSDSFLHEEAHKYKTITKFSKLNKNRETESVEAKEKRLALRQELMERYVARNGTIKKRPESRVADGFGNGKAASAFFADS